MTRFNLSIKILTVLLLISAIAIFAERSRACSACDPHGTGSIMLSQNDQGINNMNTNQDQTQTEGYAVCPVCHMKVKITNDTPFTIYGDKKYYFDTEADKDAFLKDPKKYINSMPSGNETNKPPVSGENKNM